MRRRYHPAYYQPAQRGMGAALLAELQPFHKKFFDETNKYLRDGQKEAVVVFAQTACELCTEYALTILLQIWEIQFLTRPLIEEFRARNIVDKRVREVYEGLSGDDLQKKPFLKKLDRLNTLRNKVVHKGAKCTKEEAEESIWAVGQYIRHVDRVIEKVRLQQKSR